MNVVTFVTIDYACFMHIGSIPEAMLVKVLSNSEFLKLYKLFPKFGERVITPSLKALLDTRNIQQRSRVKRKAKVVDESVPAKPRPQRNLKKKEKINVIDEDSEENTISHNHFSNIV
ncbi:unnamed protein product [Lactuca virosa]|uniref:Uncharacterized protein n=1 Tax=Lactuca virosa TaxID=75947 RepID=A0AAU9MIH1_9ASTR|nr:unnamed protein product [Lactuca virosa]